jgi:hypothetical protein
MYSLPNPIRSYRPSGISSSGGSSQTDLERKRELNALIQQANSVPLLTLFRHYGIRFDAYSNKLICPFTKHKNGRENSPSFKFYPETNTFWCFGCQTGRSSTDFVANMEGISRPKAASRILELYASEVSEDLVDVKQPNYSERLGILMDFSNHIREQLQANKDDLTMIAYLESIAEVFDKMNQKHPLDNSSLQSLADKLKSKI